MSARPRHPNRSEWIVAGLSALAVLGSLAFLIVNEISRAGKPAAPRAEVVSVTPLGSRYAVRFRAINEGGTTASGLELEGHLRAEGGVDERSTTVIEWLPPHGAREGVLVFSTDPRTGTLELRVLGYVDP